MRNSASAEVLLYLQCLILQILFLSALAYNAVDNNDLCSFLDVTAFALSDGSFS